MPQSYQFYKPFYVGRDISLLLLDLVIRLKWQLKDQNFPSSMRTPVGGTNSGLEGSSLKRLTSFRIISSNQELARTLSGFQKQSCKQIRLVA